MVAVAYSGGRDSTALLHATATAAAAQGVRVVALHVHHGLSPNADAWLAHAQRTCAAWARAGRPVDLRSLQLDGRPPPGASVEAWAREERYRALARLAHEAGATLVLLAHHRRDQAETLLLQALRGAGLAGLAAMPRQQHRDGLTWWRPWLDVDPRAIEAYARRHRLRHVDDESNRDPRWDRSRLRIAVWPALEAAFPHAEAMLARSAGWLAEAHAAATSQATGDLAELAHEGGPLDLTALRSWTRPRARQALRAWLRRALGVPAPMTLVERLMAEALAANHGRWPAPGGELRLSRGQLGFVATPGPKAWAMDRPIGLAAESAARCFGPPVAQPVASRLPPWPLNGPRRLRLPGWPGAWILRPTASGGVPWTLLQQAVARARQGGETFQAGPGRPARSLKKQFQAAGLDRWHRDGPLLWAGDVLLAVPGLGLDARVRAAEGEPQVVLDWAADPSGGG